MVYSNCQQLVTNDIMSPYSCVLDLKKVTWLPAKNAVVRAFLRLCL